MDKGGAMSDPMKKDTMAKPDAMGKDRWPSQTRCRKTR